MLRFGFERSPANFINSLSTSEYVTGGFFGLTRIIKSTPSLRWVRFSLNTSRNSLLILFLLAAFPVFLVTVSPRRDIVPPFGRYVNSSISPRNLLPFKSVSLNSRLFKSLDSLPNRKPPVKLLAACGPSPFCSSTPAVRLWSSCVP